MVVLCTLIVLPFLWMVLSSFKPRTELFSYPPTFLPARWTLGNYSGLLLYPRLNEDFTRPEFISLNETKRQKYLDENYPSWADIDYRTVATLTSGQVQVLRNSSLQRIYFNAIRIFLFAAIGTVVIGGLAGYAFAKIDFPGREVLFVLLLSSMMIPWMTVLLPRYLLFRRLGWVGGPLPLFVPELLFGTPFAIFFFRQHFRTIPSELIEAAIVDGANHWQIFWRVMMPLSKTVVLSLIFFTLLFKWNDLTGPLIYLTDTKEYTPTLMLYQMMKAVGNERDPSATGLRMAGAVLTVLPVLVTFFFAQRYFISGLTQGAVKE